MRGLRARIVVLALVAVALPLAGCGKKGAPKPPSQVEAEKEGEKTE